MKHCKRLVSLSVISFILAGCGDKETQNTNTFEELNKVKIDHIHGLGYVGHKDQLYLATHEGLIRFSDNKWYELTKNKHDYMGFQAVNTGFYSSGHPEPGSDLKNPLGLIKSTDEGKTFKKLAFYGETDFHYLAVGYNHHMIYAINQTPNSQLDTGLYYSEDDGKTWSQSKMEGITASSIGYIATHPSNSNMIGISTDKGLYVSESNGDLFTLASEAFPVTTLEYGEESILFFATGTTPTLYKQDIVSKNNTKISIPNEVNIQNPIIFISSNPNKRDEITVITHNNDIYQTKDSGSNWTRLVRNSKVE